MQCQQDVIEQKCVALGLLRMWANTKAQKLMCDVDRNDIQHMTSLLGLGLADTRGLELSEGLPSNHSRNI